MSEKIEKNAIIIIVVLLMVISIAIRVPKENERYCNCDATYHTLLTMQCYDETPISVHKFLPIVSLGDEEDKNISWGSCIKDSNGNYYYNSFSPVGFVMPYVFVKLFHLPINIYSLYAFNSILYVATFGLIAYIFCKLFSKYISKNLIILFTGLIYLFQMEVMHSQGVIFWVQSIFQLLLAVQFILFMNYKNKKAKICFFIMCLFMPYVEWTGYVSNVGFAIIIFIQKIIEDKKLSLKAFLEPFMIGVLTILSFVLFSCHFLLNIDLESYMKILQERFFARNITNTRANFIDLLKGYFISYKYMILLCVGMLITILSLKTYRKQLWSLIKEYKYPIIFFSFILLENVIMVQHAIEYRFDRLKFSYLLILIFYIMLLTIYICSKENKTFLMHCMTVVLIMISVMNVINYQRGYGKYITQDKYGASDKIMMEYITQRFNHSNSIICSSKSVRGYINLLFHRGIYEHAQYDQAQYLAQIHNKKYVVYLEIYPEDIMDMNIKKIYIKDLENNNENVIYVQNNELQIKGKQLVE